MSTHQVADLRPEHWPQAAGVWTIQTGIFPENEASVRLHEQVGYEIVGRRKRLGKLHGIWRDVLLLERRSDVVE